MNVDLKRELAAAQSAIRGLQAELKHALTEPNEARQIAGNPDLLDIARESVRARMNEHMQGKRIAELERVLRLARMSLEQGQDINGHIAANGPSIGSIIDDAMKEKK